MTDVLDWLFGLEQFGIKFGLDNIRSVLGALGDPQRRFQSVHVAGTNGKGSVAAMVDAVLRAAGHRTARYTSPHLLDLTERFVVDGRAIEAGTLAAATARVREVVEDLRRTGRLDVHPTFFEVTTAIAFELFRRAEVDIAVCEVGLGGRLDATNVLEPVATAITSIGLDHQQYLGHTLREIALEKAGIIKQGVPVVVGKLPAEALDAVTATARDRGAELIKAADGVSAASVESDLSRTSSDARQYVQLRTPARDYGNVTIGLAGAHQIDNAVVAVRVLETVDRQGISVPPAAIVNGLQCVRWPGRLERRELTDGRELLLDAAHNPDGAVALAAFLGAHADPRRPLVFAAMRDKDVRGMLHALAPAVSALVLTRASHPRSAEPSELAEHARAIAPHLPAIVAPSAADALRSAWRLSRSIVVAGSIFLLADVMKEIDGS